MDLFSTPSPREPTAREARSGDAGLSQWFTPFWVAEELMDRTLSKMGHVSVCEPSCGTGAFLAAVPESYTAFGVEIDPSLVPAAIANSGREVLVGDFRTVDIGDRRPELIIGNPPFEVDVFEGFLDRALDILPEDGCVAMLIPAYFWQTPARVTRWMSKFSIEVNLVPRTLFPGLSKPLTWSAFQKTSARRFSGLLMFAETRDIEAMRPAFREALARPGTWRETVSLALQSLGGQASLKAIYDAIAPERQTSPHWRPKIRQTLQRGGFRALGEGRWALAPAGLAQAA
ncbi:class I SAM-dependent methyltransferase [Sphingosinicella sp. BN140058]|uniref:class I SAM-dependent methyltransferase n=1 Tax=Sphingosinicella sp. BN140058 TaxID=1892855 RepID=UPI001010E9C3|nr:class I SAM-dependent methyltransferase [Sphingosinicella sp. BN140058]QAY80158.1 class I SAM-dependent methyltransferase [Sphingosinicella sp. BN140058]